MLVAMSPHAGSAHEPVLVAEVTALLREAPDGVIVDGTVGAGGHAASVAMARQSRFGHAHLVGIDRDPHALGLARERLAELPGDTVTFALVQARFDELATVLDGEGVDTVAGILLDLGVSSMQLDQAERGFAFRHDGPLDMRMDPSSAPSAAELVNEASFQQLAYIFRTYGEERFADRIARAVERARPVTTTRELADVVVDAVPAAARRAKSHPATRVFQALRIAVNGELDALERVLPVAVERLMPGGVLVVLSYHSLEDRRVKQAFAAEATGCVCPPSLAVCGCGRSPRVEHLVRRAQKASESEVAINPRARSVRLRAVRRVAQVAA